MTIAAKILKNQLNYQFLDDGMHYELSPMYHASIINELLKCYDLLLKNAPDNDYLKRLIKNRLEHAMGFYNFMSIDDYFPYLNDSFFSPDLRNGLINKKFNLLGLKPKSIVQGKGSGYRKYIADSMTLVFDAGQIGPNHQPGHAHADSLTFCLYHGSDPLIVDTGTSVYENNKRRYIERSTDSHNTIKYKNVNSSEVWSSFRVGRIAKTFIENEGQNFISSYHNGYEFLGLIHNRSIKIEKKLITVHDFLNNEKIVFSYLHFHPKTKVKVHEKKIILDEVIIIELENFLDFKLESYMHAKEFNKLEKGIKFVGKLKKYSKFFIKRL